MLCEFLELNKICYAEIEQTYDTYVKKRREAIEVKNNCYSLVVAKKHVAANR